MEKAREFLSTQDNDGKDYLDSHVVEEKPKSSEKKKKKRRIPKKWIISILILIAIAFGVYWFLNRDDSGSSKTNDGNNKVTITAHKIHQYEDETVIKSGAYSFEMEEGDETIWIKLPTNRNVIYEIGSPNDEWLIHYSDGTILKGSENPILPTKENVVFKIKSLKKQTVNLIIK